MRFINSNKNNLKPKSVDNMKFLTHPKRMLDMTCRMRISMNRLTSPH